MSKYKKLADKSAKEIDEEKLTVSFEYLDMDTEEFFFHGLEADFYKKFFRCITTIKQAINKEIAEQTHPSLIPKSIFNKKGTKGAFPSIVVDKVKDKLFVETRDEADSEQKAIEITSGRAFELRITKVSGRIHGFLWNNRFYVVWIDPAHNLYPLNQFGIRKQEDYAKVRCCSIEELCKLKDELKNLQDEYDELFTAYAELDGS
ncbi:hypothetical protein QNE83_000972 [Vibrio alginolyticus]|nr:hypothetical protein [Vibrio alginolyticus]EJR0950346.1 hypothetical protein [Vibrio alginolyticus]ELB2868149.1 hypothetical protein [Vibrio alginolyticus]